MLNLFIHILIIVNTWLLFLTIYTLFLSLFGFKKKVKRTYYDRENKLKFLIVVPSHNEETIIESSIENLSKISYEKSLFDVVYIADNCSDLTTYFANNKIKQLNLNNFHVYERFAEASDPSGKPHAIQWLLKEQIKDVYNKYDIVSIIDADNFVDDNMLTEINSQFLCSGENVKAIQIYPDSKNYSNFVARGYASAYYITNRFWQLAKSRIGLNTALAGTGMFFRSAFLEENNGFNATSLVEDLELQTKITLSGNQVKWNHNVRIYDEKPTKSKASLIQKTRWAQGHWWVAFNYGYKLLWKAVFSKHSIAKRLRMIDNFIYLFSMGKAIQILLIAFSIFVIIILVFFKLETAVYYASEIFYYKVTFAMIFMWLFLQAYNLIILLFVALKNDAKIKYSPKFHFKAIFSLIYGMYIYLIAQLLGLLKHRNQNVWKKTEHEQTTSELSN